MSAVVFVCAMERARIPMHTYLGAAVDRFTSCHSSTSNCKVLALNRQGLT